jgi:transcriptional regulator with XRE-family HTH domain
VSPARERRSQGVARLARMRIDCDLSQAELAAAAGLSKPTVERLEHSRVANPGIRHLLALAAALDCELDDLIEDRWRPPTR